MQYINSKSIPYILLFLALVYIFLMHSCNGNKIIPKGKEIVKYDTIYNPGETKTNYITKYKTIKGDVIEIPGRIDTVEVKTFELAKDTTKTKMYVDATRIREYKNVFSDSLADVSIFTETKGELLKIVPTVTIKARLPAKETVFAVYGGLEVYNNLDFNNVGAKVNLMFQNKRGDLITGAYDTNKNIYLGYNFRFLNIKK